MARTNRARVRTIGGSNDLRRLIFLDFLEDGPQKALEPRRPRESQKIIVKSYFQFCYPLDEYHEKLPFMERDTTAYKASDFNKEDQALSTGGIALE